MHSLHRPRFACANTVVKELKAVLAATHLNHVGIPAVEDVLILVTPGVSRHPTFRFGLADWLIFRLMTLSRICRIWKVVSSPERDASSRYPECSTT